MASQTKFATLMDVARRTSPDGSIERQIAEIYNQVNMVLADAHFIECNDGMQHITTVRNGLPTSAWMRLYKGYTVSKSTTTQVSDGCGTIGTSSEIDVRMLERMQDPMGFRLSETWPHFESMNQTFATAFFYGNSGVNVDQFTGLSPRYPKYGGTDSKITSYNVIDGGGRGATNASIWFVGWGPRSIHCLYPKGSKAGIRHQNKGENIPVLDGDSNRYFAAVDTYDWDVGLSVRDWRFACRICNIDVAAIAAGGGNQADIMQLLITAYNKVRIYMNANTAPEAVPMATRWCIYANLDVITYLDLQSYNVVKNALINYQVIDGQSVLTFRGIPIRHCTALVSTEAACASA